MCRNVGWVCSRIRKFKTNEITLYETAVTVKAISGGDWMAGMVSWWMGGMELNRLNHIT